MEEFQQIVQQQSDQEPKRDRKCPQCGSRSETIFQKEASMLTYVLSFISLFIFQFWSIFVIPVIISATQQVAKRCYDCDAVIEKHDLFSLPSVNDQILNFRFGTFAFIVSRKYAYGLLAIFVILFTYSSLTKEVTPIAEDDSIQQLELSKTWIDYLKDCGSQVYLENSVRANSHFQQVYHKNIINWEGVYIECRDCPEDLASMSPHQEYILKIKMIPTDSALFDVILRVPYETNLHYIEILKSIKSLDVIKFRGELEYMGNEQSYHKIILLGVENTGRNIQRLDEIKTALEIGVFD